MEKMRWHRADNPTSQRDAGRIAESVPRQFLQRFKVDSCLGEYQLGAAIQFGGKQNFTPVIQLARKRDHFLHHGGIL